ncbi:hypothetical protein BU15DRAFT_47979 [Melanogaster broomeanus]|nr:hypothetical protein BU15DRAFT_47979 [Melanogaster broomeanus]
MGTLNLTSKYLTAPNFNSTNSNPCCHRRFLSLDEGPDFTPTLAKNQQRDSMPALPGSLPLRTSLPKSPPSSVAGQFVLPPTHSRTISMPGSQSPRSAALPVSRTSTNMATAGSTSALSITSSRQEGSTAWSKEEGASLPGAAARIRRESTSTTGRSSLDLPSAPGPLPIRKPHINHINPFKSSTLSSGSPSIHSPSPSHRQPSPLATGTALPSLPSRPTQTSPNSSRVQPPPISPIVMSRPSPPFAPSSLGDRRSLASAEGEDTSPRLPTRKRYSSSFGHRYAASGGAASDGSPGSGGERKDGDKAGGSGAPPLLGPTTDDDEISIFVQEIDARKPLASRQPLTMSPQSALTSSPGALGRPVAGGASGASKRSSMGPMLTREAEVDEKLKHMHEVFLASLEGLGSGSSRRRDNTSGSAGARGSGSGSGSRGGDGPGKGDESGGSSRSNSWAEYRGQGGGVGSASPTDVASSGGSAEVMGRLELDEDSRRRRRYGE